MEAKFKDLQVGAKVIVSLVSFGKRTEYIGTVVKKTPSGLLDVNYANLTERFKPNGRLYRRYDEFQTTYTVLVEYTETKAKEIEENKRRRKLINFLEGADWHKYTTEELLAIVDGIKQLRST